MDEKEIEIRLDRLSCEIHRLVYEHADLQLKLAEKRLARSGHVTMDGASSDPWRTRAAVYYNALCELEAVINDAIARFRPLDMRRLAEIVSRAIAKGAA